MALKIPKVAVKIGQPAAQQQAAPAPAPAPAPPAPMADHSEPFTNGVQVAPERSTAVAASPTNYGGAGPVRSVQASAAGGLMPAEADEGFGGLENEIGFGSFTIVKLDKNKYIVGNEEVDEFECVMVRARAKYVFKASTREDAAMCYTYDCVHGTDGRSLDTIFNEWRQDGELDEGAQPVKSRYFEVVAQLVNTKMAGQMVLFSVAPMSVPRLAGYQATLKAMHGLKLSEVVSKCFVGAKVTPKSGKTFYPWDFALVGIVEKETA